MSNIHIKLLTRLPINVNIAIQEVNILDMEALDFFSDLEDDDIEEIEDIEDIEETSDKDVVTTDTPFKLKTKTKYDKDGVEDEHTTINSIMPGKYAPKVEEIVEKVKKRIHVQPTKINVIHKDVEQYMLLLDGDELNPAQDIVLRHYIASANLSVAARSAGVKHSTVIEWAEHDKLFAQRLREATDIITGMLEAEGLRRALQSSDRLLIKMLEAMSPDKYARKTQTSINSTFQGRMDINVNSWSELSQKAVEIEDAIAGEVLSVETVGDDEEVVGKKKIESVRKPI